MKDDCKWISFRPEAKSRENKSDSWFMKQNTAWILMFMVHGLTRGGRSSLSTPSPPRHHTSSFPRLALPCLTHIWIGFFSGTNGCVNRVKTRTAWSQTWAGVARSQLVESETRRRERVAGPLVPD